MSTINDLENVLKRIAGAETPSEIPRLVAVARACYAALPHEGDRRAVAPLMEEVDKAEKIAAFYLAGVGLRDAIARAREDPLGLHAKLAEVRATYAALPDDSRARNAACKADLEAAVRVLEALTT